MLKDTILHFDIEVVKAFGTFDSATALLAYTKPLMGVEGFVVDFGGHKVKCKAEHYVMIHRTKDQIRSDRHIAAFILNSELDDLLPVLDESDLKLVHAFETRFEAALENVLGRLEGLVDLAIVIYGGDKKRIALEFVPHLINKEDAPFIFRCVAEGKDALRENILKKVKDATSTNTKFDTCMDWMEA